MEYNIMEKKCVKCEINRPIEKFRKYCENNSYASTCKSCLNELDKIRKKDVRRKKYETQLVKCEKCNEEKVLKEFTKLKKFYKKKICLSCYPEFLKEQKMEWCRTSGKTNMNYRIKKSIAARLRTVLVKF
jgi:hypothetical protein